MSRDRYEQKVEDCPNCEGRGEYEFENSKGETWPVDCDMCEGSGEIITGHDADSEAKDRRIQDEMDEDANRK